MKKTFALSILFALLIMVVPSFEAQAAQQTNRQIRGEIRQDRRELRRDRRKLRSSRQRYDSNRYNSYNRYNRYNHGARVTYRTRYVRSGYRLYKETYRISYLPNGRTQTRIVSRTRVR